MPHLDSALGTLGEQHEAVGDIPQYVLGRENEFAAPENVGAAIPIFPSLHFAMVRSVSMAALERALHKLDSTSRNVHDMGDQLD